MVPNLTVKLVVLEVLMIAIDVSAFSFSFSPLPAHLLFPIPLSGDAVYISFIN
jgi:hypothetical protein